MKLSLCATQCLAAAVLLSSVLSVMEMDGVYALTDQPHVREPGRIKLGQCQLGVRARKEIRSLSDDERKRFFDAMRKLQSGAGPTRYDQFGEVHDGAHKYAHGNAIFLPWHRRLQRELEIDLQLVDESIMLPYWDWSIDSQAPEKSIIFSAEYFGGNGRKGDNCVTDGQFKDWRPSYPKPGCLKRKFDKGDKIGAMYTTDSIQKIITANKSFVKFAKKLEGNPHARVHNGIAGTMRTMHSTIDPIFFMHHGMIDKIWWQWQEVDKQRLRDFSGKLYDNSTATIDTKMEPWNDMTTGDMLDTRALCYTYADLPATQVEKSPYDTVPDNKAAAPAPVTDKVAAVVAASDTTSVPYDKSLGQLLGSTAAPAVTGDQPQNTDNTALPPPTTEQTDSSPSVVSLLRRSYEETREPMPDMYNTYGNVEDRMEERKEKRSCKKCKCKCNRPVEPVDDGADVPLTESTTHASITPTSDNRESLTKTRLPPATPRDWLEMNGQSVAEVRQYEAEDKELYDQLNSIPGYVSPCALINRGDIITALVQAGQTVFTAGYGRQRVPITVNSANPTANLANDIKQVVQDVRKQVVSYITTNPFDGNLAYNATNVVEQVTNLIGHPEEAGINLRSAENFLLSAARDHTNGWVPIEQSLAAIEEAIGLKKDCAEDEYEQPAPVEEEEEDCDEEEPIPEPISIPEPIPEPTPINAGEDIYGDAPAAVPCNTTTAPVAPQPEPYPIEQQPYPVDTPIPAGEEDSSTVQPPVYEQPAYEPATPVQPEQPPQPTKTPCNTTAPVEPYPEPYPAEQQPYPVEQQPIPAGEEDNTAMLPPTFVPATPVQPAQPAQPIETPCNKTTPVEPYPEQQQPTYAPVPAGDLSNSGDQPAVAYVPPPTPVEPAQLPVQPVPTPCNTTTPSQPQTYDQATASTQSQAYDQVPAQSQAYDQVPTPADAGQVEAADNNNNDSTNYYGNNYSDVNANSAVDPTAGDQNTVRAQSYQPTADNNNAESPNQREAAYGAATETSAY